jgi:hypothetical protein
VRERGLVQDMGTRALLAITGWFATISIAHVSDLLTTLAVALAWGSFAVLMSGQRS